MNETLIIRCTVTGDSFLADAKGSLLGHIGVGGTFADIDAAQAWCTENGYYCHVENQTSEHEAARRAYQDKLDTKRERLDKRAEKAQHESDAAFKRAHDLAYIIDGQPILVGHHSEKRARRDQERIRNGMHKGIDEQKKAKHLRDRAAAVGSGGISAIEDPDAKEKLEAKVQTLEGQRDEMKRVNQAYRTCYRAALKHGRSQEEAEKEALSEALKDTTWNIRQDALTYVGRATFTYSWDRQPFPVWVLTNLSARIRSTGKQTKQVERIETLKAEGPQILGEGEGWLVETDPDESRIVLRVAERLPADSYQVLKRSGWRWSPTRRAFLQYLNPRGRWQADEVVKQITTGAFKLSESK